MSEISGSGDIQSWRQESETAELVAGQPIDGAVDKVASGYDQTNSVSQSQPEKADYFLAPRVIPVPTLQAALQGVTVASSEDIKGLLSKALASRESLEQRPAGEEAESLSVVATNVSPSVANTGSLALQRVIDDIVSINRNSGRASGNGAQSVQQNRSDLYEMTEHVQLKLLSQRLGIDLNPLIRTGEGGLEGILVIQRGILLAIDAMSNAEFMEVLKERLREEQVKEDQIKEGQNKESVEKLMQAIAALKSGEPKVAAEVLRSASLITTAIEQIVDRYTSDETPGSLRQHLHEQLILVLDSVTRQGSYQDMMNKRVELLHSAKKV